MRKNNKFKDIFNLGEPFTSIHPYKQKAVKHLVDNKPSWVTHIIIFGSAVGTWHFYEKDLDVCLIGKDPQKTDERDCNYQRVMKLPDVEYDFLVYDTFEDLNRFKDDVGSVQYHISKEGVVVFAED